ncbi:MAG: hypothetical protein JST14_01240, partial [Bacteroidetes bacterium]|nr:hypothetical protein [Bacteroidota bacterium]
MINTMNWRHPTTTRILILLGTVFFLGWALKSGSVTLSVLLIVAAGFQVVRLLHVLESGEGTPDLSGIYFDETTQSFKSNTSDGGTQYLCGKMNEAYNASRNNKRDKDSDYQFFRNIVQHVGIGLLTFRKDGAVQIINSAARRLLRVTQIQNIAELNSVSPMLVEAFQKLKTGGRELIRLKLGDETIQLS